jgi:hypothetical protein
MNDRISVKSDQQIVSTEAGLAATIGFAFWRPVGGEMFFLTAPFIEHYGVYRYLTGFSPEDRVAKEELSAENRSRQDGTGFPSDGS